jgi:hypothetical protein
MDTQKNTYLASGHNYQDARLTVYLPGNGGLLTGRDDGSGLGWCAGRAGTGVSERRTLDGAMGGARPAAVSGAVDGDPLCPFGPSLS